jgi:Co/Zn/Cd efflux system component
MSVVLLISSVVYELFGIGWIDILGTIGLAWFSFTEGRECFEKAKTEALCGCHQQDKTCNDR